MLKMNKRLALTLAATLATAFAATTAYAGPNHRIKQRFGNYDVDVDIQARINHRGPALLKVRYDVEVEGRRVARQPLNLVLTIQAPHVFNGCNHAANVRCGSACSANIYRGQRGVRGARFNKVPANRFRPPAPYQVVIPLDRPTDIDRGELEFESSINIRLPQHLARQAHNLIVDAKVINQRNGNVLDTDRTTVQKAGFGQPRIQPHRPGFGNRGPRGRF